MRNIKMTIEYDGSNFKGFQRLKDNDNTIQGKIEDVLSKLTNEKIEIIGSGRTDMGVHAVGQVVNFKTNCSESVEKIQKYLYKYLPESIVVRKIEEVDDRFHSRYNAKSKVYLYKIDNNKFHNPFNRKFTHHVERKLDIEKMKEASKALIGEHDFSSFASSRSKKKSHVRTIESISIQENNGLIEIYVKGNGQSTYTAQSSIPTGQYILNTSKTFCENGGTVSNYDNNAGTVLFTTLGSDVCSLYFDYQVHSGGPGN